MLKSMDCVPSMKGSTALVIVVRREMRDIVATGLQCSVAPVIKGALLPCSNARRRALLQHQHRLNAKAGNLRITKIQPTGIEIDPIENLLIQNRPEIDCRFHDQDQLFYVDCVL